MKSLIYSVLLLSSLTAYACQEESQFIATIESSQYTDEGECRLQVKEFEHYNPSSICPLWQTDVMEEGITTRFGRETCARMPGSTFSGYLVRPINSDQILLE